MDDPKDEQDEDHDHDHPDDSDAAIPVHGTSAGWGPMAVQQRRAVPRLQRPSGHRERGAPRISRRNELVTLQAQIKTRVPALDGSATCEAFGMARRATSTGG